MKINKAKTSSYDSVTPENIVRYYIKDYAHKIDTAVNGGSLDEMKRLENADKTQLKAIAAELETVCKRLDWILEGKY